jgi:CDP-glucose 4,6-dehydratase
VLITGHTGFKGGWLALWLQSLQCAVGGLSVDVPTEPSTYVATDVSSGMAHEVRADVRDPAAVDRAVQAFEPEVVFHLAAQSLVRRSYAEPRETYEVNVLGTVNLLDAVRRSSTVRVVVVITTDKCYENRGWDWGYREAEPMGGHDPYSSSKGAAELVTAAYRSSFFADDSTVRVASARAGNVIGGGDWADERLVPDIVRARSADRAVRIRSPDAIRPWQHVLNPLSGYLLLAQGLWTDPQLATAWNFGPPEDDARTVGWIVEQLRERWGESFVWERDATRQPHEASYLKLDSSRARARLGWRPPVTLDRALDSIVAWHGAFDRGADMRGFTATQLRELAGV